MKKLFALLLALSLVLSLCACGEKKEEVPSEPLDEELTAEEENAQPAETEEEPEAPAEEEQPEEAPEEETTEEPAEEELPELGGIAGEADGYWYEVDAGTGTYTDSAGNEQTYTYAIPAFHVDSADASAMNAEIESVCGSYVEEMKTAEAESYSLSTYSVSYEACQNENIVSILITVSMESDVVEYHVYNLDVATGAKASGADLIAAVGLTEDDFIAAAQQVASDKFKELYGAMEGDSVYEEQYAKTMSADAYSLATPMFLNGSGKLCIVARIYAMAGAPSYDYILEVV